MTRVPLEKCRSALGSAIRHVDRNKAEAAVGTVRPGNTSQQRVCVTSARQTHTAQKDRRRISANGTCPEHSQSRGSFRFCAQTHSITDGRTLGDTDTVLLRRLHLGYTFLRCTLYVNNKTGRRVRRSTSRGSSEHRREEFLYVNRTSPVPRFHVMP